MQKFRKSVHCRKGFTPLEKILYFLNKVKKYIANPFRGNFSNRLNSLTGFTLIELIIVLTIIGIASGLVGILIHSGSDNLDLRTFTKEVSATLRYARNHAVAEKKVYSFNLWKDKKTYALYTEAPDKNEASEEPEPLIHKPVPESLELFFENREDNIKIDFFPQGNSSGGAIEVKNKKGKTFFILVNRVTGIVEVKKRQ